MASTKSYYTSHSTAACLVNYIFLNCPSDLSSSSCVSYMKIENSNEELQKCEEEKDLGVK